MDLSAGIRYQTGTFETEHVRPDGTPESGQFNIDVTVYLNGWMVDSRASTEVCDRFLFQVSEWMHQDFRFAELSRCITQTMHDSALLVESDSLDLDKSLDRVDAFSQSIKDLTGNKEHSMWSIDWRTEGADGAPLFAFERRLGVPFSERKYFSRTALPTPKHIELLQAFESIFGG
jgi:hypothetical protein